MPFWLEQAIDWKYGGIFTGIDDDGTVVISCLSAEGAQKALEIVMPPEDRKFAAMRRREAKADDQRDADEEEALASFE